MRLAILASVLFLVLGCSGLAAQDLSGTYQLENRPNVTLEIRQATTVPPIYVGGVYVDGELVEDETMFIYPTRDGWRWRNARGNEGTVTQDADGNLEAEVTTGPNAGRRTKWEKK
ncbi:MAG: hypothetical protein IPM29_24770 [Planctomycetes bacterium]|nr:hypothetical protein [Planctomycetota bacterium]